MYWKALTKTVHETWIFLCVSMLWLLQSIVYVGAFVGAGMISFAELFQTCALLILLSMIVLFIMLYFSNLFDIYANGK